MEQTVSDGAPDRPGRQPLDCVTSTNSGIEPAADNVAVPVVDGDFKANVRVFRKKRQDDRRERVREQYLQGRSFDSQAQRPDRLVAERIDVLKGVIDAVEDGLYFSK